MKLLNRALWGVGLFAVAILLTVVVAPRTTHALVATLVTVTNTSSNPIAIASADSPGLHPFTASCTAIQGSCSLNVPSGYELVIQNIAVSLSAPSNPFVSPGEFYLNTSIGGTAGLAFAQPISAPSQSWSLTTYADPQSAVNFSADNGSPFTARIQGYYVISTGSSSISGSGGSSAPITGGWDVTQNKGL